MPTRSSKTADANQAAKRILDELTGDTPTTVESAKVKATRVAGKRGGNARAVVLTPEQRADIARTAATVSNRWILLKDSNVPALAKQISPMRRRHFVQRPVGPTVIEIAPPSVCVALRAIDATSAAFDLQLDLRRLHD